MSITIVINFDEDGERKWSATKDGDKLDLDGNIFIFQVENKAGATLPTTGGIGTTLFYAIGGILVLAAVVLLITKKRMSNEA